MRRPLFVLLFTPVLAALASASPEDVAAYRRDLETAFRTGAPFPAVPAGLRLPADLTSLVELVAESQAGTSRGADEEKMRLRAVIEEAARGLSPTAPARPAPDVIAAYLSRVRQSAATAARPPHGARPDARVVMARATRAAALLGQESSFDADLPAGSIVPAGPTAAARDPARPLVQALPAAALPVRFQSDVTVAVPRIIAQPQTAPAPERGVIARMASWSADTAVGYGTGAVNLVLDAANLVNRGVNLGLSATPLEYRFRTDMRVAPASDAEAYAQNAVDVAALIGTGVGLVRSAPTLARWSEQGTAAARNLGERLLTRGRAAEPASAPRAPPRRLELELPPDPVLPRTPVGSLPARGEPLGRGQFTDVYMARESDCVLKVVRTDVGAGAPIELADRAAIAARTVEQHAILRARGFPVPESWVSASDPTIVVQRFSGGHRSVPFNRLDPSLRSHAADRAIDMRSAASRDRSVRIDDGGLQTNFRFDPRTGEITAWIDPAIPVDTQQLSHLSSRIWAARGGY